MAEEQNLPKSIDGVRPMPRLSGENQEHHLGEPTVPVAPEPTVTQPAQPTAGVGAAPTPTEPARHESFPLAAVAMAMVVGLSLIGLAIYLQIQST